MQNTSKYSDFFDRPTTIKWILRVFYFLCIALVIADFLVHRHTMITIEKLPGFYALYGFIACVVLVLIASQMRKWLMRGEEYYEPLDPETDKQYPDGYTSHSNAHLKQHGDSHS